MEAVKTLMLILVQLRLKLEMAAVIKPESRCFAPPLSELTYGSN